MEDIRCARQSESRSLGELPEWILGLLVIPDKLQPSTQSIAASQSQRQQVVIMTSHRPQHHEWPWSCLECEFSGENGEACYYHLRDVHSYQLAKKRKFGTASSDTDVSPGDRSERLRKEARCEPRVSWKLECELVQVGIPRKKGAKIQGNSIEITCDAESLPETTQDLHPLDASSLAPYIGNSATVPAKDLDLAFTARSSLSLLESCPSNTLLLGMLAGSLPTTESSHSEDQDVSLGRSNLDPSLTGQAALMSPPPSRSPTAMVTDMNPTSSKSSPHGPSPRLATPPVSQKMPPYAASNTGSAIPGQVTPGGKKRRIKIITASYNRSENTDNIESPPPRKKCRITLKTRPRIQSGNEHAGDAKAVQDTPQEERRNKQAKVAKPTKTRIILKTGSRRLH